MYFSVDHALIEAKHLMNEQLITNSDEIDEFIQLIELDYKSDTFYHHVHGITNPRSLEENIWDKEELITYVNQSSNPWMKYAYAHVTGLGFEDGFDKLSIPELHPITSIEKCKLPIEFSIESLTFTEVKQLLQRIDKLDLWHKLNLPSVNGLDVYLVGLIKADIHSKKAWTWLANLGMKFYTSRSTKTLMIKPIQERVFSEQLKSHGLGDHPINILFKRNISFKASLYFSKVDYAFNLMTFVTKLELEITDKVTEALNKVLDENTTKRLIRLLERTSYLDLTFDEVVNRFSSFLVTPE
jgi:hypothetical protein